MSPGDPQVTTTVSPRSGSIVVGHRVIFSMAESGNATEKFQEATEELVENLRETAAGQLDCRLNTCE